MDEKRCQSCGMSMDDPEVTYGTNADGGKNEAYCQYCFENGAFTEECTMEEMIAACVPYVATAESGMNEDEAEGMLRTFFPTLKRWKA